MSCKEQRSGLNVTVVSLIFVGNYSIHGLHGWNESQNQIPITNQQFPKLTKIINSKSIKSNSNITAVYSETTKFIAHEYY